MYNCYKCHSSTGGRLLSGYYAKADVKCFASLLIAQNKNRSHSRTAQKRRIPTDIKEHITNTAEKITKDKTLMEKFQKAPISTAEGVMGVDQKAVLDLHFFINIV